MAVKVVVIEDEEFLTELIRVNLRLRGIDVTTAEYGEDGYAKVLEIKPDLILLDARLPDIDGWEICKRIKSNDEINMIPVVFVTAAAQESDRLRAKEAGADGFLAKPFQITELLNTIKKYSVSSG
ncbi:MAG: response regulator [Fibrobacter sp.]|jgi:two-component system alkaline phosphatase synthesis response regulator PhoP|nr:response regulator [Fibrobacter sp.]